MADDEQRDPQVEAIAVAWLHHLGYTNEDLDALTPTTHQDFGCEFDGNRWNCVDEDGKSRHPVWDDVTYAAEFANIALDTLTARGELLSPRRLVDVEPPPTGEERIAQQMADEAERREADRG